MKLIQRIQYAKTKSDLIAKADGTFVPRERRKRHEERGITLLYCLVYVSYFNFSLPRKNFLLLINYLSPYLLIIVILNFCYVTSTGCANHQLDNLVNFFEV